MKNLSLLFVAFIFLHFTSLAQAPDTLWTKTFGGSGKDIGYSVQQTIDGGYILCGSTGSFGTVNEDLWLLKTDAYGEILWTKIYGGNHYDIGLSVQQTTDGGYIICGRTYSFGNWGNEDLWLIKTDANGDTVWTKTLSGIGHAAGQSVQQTNDGGYIIVGNTSTFLEGSDVWLVKTDANGDTIWTKKYEGSEDESGKTVQQTNDGGYIITGSTNFKAIPQNISCIFDSNENNYESNEHGDSDLLIIKTDASGDTIWTKTYGGDKYDCGNSILQTNDNGFILVGEANLFEDGGNVWLIKIDFNGDTLWTKNYGGEGKYECGNSVKLNSEGGYIVCGNKYSAIGRGYYVGDLWLIYTDAIGDTICTKTYGGSDSDEGYTVNYTNDGGYIICGSTDSKGAGNDDVWLIKVAMVPTSIKEASNKVQKNYFLFSNYPNPFNPSTKIKYSIPQSSNAVIKVFDIIGNEIETLVNEEKSVGTYEVTWYAESLPSGIYFYRLQAGTFVETKKMVLMK